MSPLAIPPVLCGLAPLEPKAPAAALAIAVVGSGHPSRGHSHRWTRRVADVLMSQTARQTIAPSSNPSVPPCGMVAAGDTPATADVARLISVNDPTN